MEHISPIKIEMILRQLEDVHENMKSVFKEEPMLINPIGGIIDSLHYELQVQILLESEKAQKLEELQ